MDKPLSVQQNKISKNYKNSKNKKPLKVVYISNPRRVMATPSEFRALVQELTGKNASVPESYHFDSSEERHVAGDDVAEEFSSEVSNTVSEGVKVSDPEFDSYYHDDNFFSSFLESSLVYESPPVDYLLASLDEV